MFTGGWFVLPILLLYGIRKYIERKWGKCSNLIQLDGKVAIVTGANSGIGFEVTKELAARNAIVILACRNMNNANYAIGRIKKSINCSGFLIPMELDLGSLKSIENFVNEFKKNYNELHILINNAGVSYPQTKPAQTEDGLEIHFGVNHVGHFYLTNLLLDVLKNSRPSRVVIVSSKLHEKGRIILDDSSSEMNRPNFLYASSKLANIYFCRELAQRLKHEEVGVFALCPGWIYTNLFRHSIKWYHYFMLAPVAFFFMRSPKQGAQTVIYCATEPGLESGVIYRDCKMYESSHNFDSQIGIKLWDKCEKLVQKPEAF